MVHDMPWERLDEVDKYSDQMDAFRTRQPPTFKHASLAIIGGRQEEESAEVQIREDSWAELKEFLRRAARSRTTTGKGAVTQ